jgi:hypothetical protein
MGVMTILQSLKFFQLEISCISDLPVASNIRKLYLQNTTFQRDKDKTVWSRSSYKHSRMGTRVKSYVAQGHSTRHYTTINESLSTQSRWHSVSTDTTKK